jgi:23S rRNA (guanine2445-N2)-methyltransferase / 23S rRNA (guanine2069-N7)-methyltransferase
MEGVLDIALDHPQLIDSSARLLAPGGLLVFSTNAQRFKLAEELSGRHRILDISSATLPEDFARNPRIHRCYEIRTLQGAAAQVGTVDRSKTGSAESR